MAGLFDEWDQELSTATQQPTGSGGGLFDAWDSELGFNTPDVKYDTMASEQAAPVDPRQSAMLSAEEKGELGWGEAVGGGVVEGGKDVARSYASSWLGQMRGLQKGAVDSLREDGYTDEEIMVYMQGGELPERETSDPVDWVREKLQRAGVTRGIHNAAERQEGRTLEHSALADPNMQRDLEFEYRKEMTGGVKGFAADVSRVVPQVGGQVVAHMAGGPVLSGLNIMSNITGMDYERLLEKGVDPHKAYNAAFWDAVMQAPLEQIGVGKITNAMRGVVGQKIRKIAEAGLTEGLTEYLQAYPEKFTELFATDPDARTLHEVEGFADAVLNKEFQRDAGYQGLVGMAAGGGSSTVGAGVSSAMDMLSGEQEEQPGMSFRPATLVEAYDASGGLQAQEGVRLSPEQFPKDVGYTVDDVNQRYDQAHAPSQAPFPEAMDLLGMDTPEVIPEKPVVPNSLPVGSAMSLPPGGPVVIPQPTEQTGFGPIAQPGPSAMEVPQGLAPAALPAGREAMPMGQYSEPIEMYSPNFEMVPNEGKHYRPDFEMVEGGVPAVRSAMEPAPVDLFSTNGKPHLSQSPRNGSSSDANLSSDTANTHPLFKQGFDSFKRERQHVVISQVASALRDKKVFNAVVESIPVDVMDNLIGTKGATQMVLHDPSVLTHRLTVPGDVPVPQSVVAFIDSLPSEIVGGAAFFPAEEKSLPRSSGASEGGPAMGTDSLRALDALPATEMPSSGSLGAGSATGESLTAGVAGEGDKRHTKFSFDGEVHEVNTSPTEAQKQAGVYKKGHVRTMGMDISIENPAGSERSGTDTDGKPWAVKMHHHYGYIKGTVGKDKDHLDIFLKEGAEAEDIETSPVYVVDQVNDDGSFDEHKILAGFESEQEAREGYFANYEDGWQGLGAITSMSPDQFKGWAQSGKTKKPLALDDTTLTRKDMGNKSESFEKDTSHKIPKAPETGGVHLKSDGTPYTEKAIRLVVNRKIKMGTNVEAVQLDQEGKQWGWREVKDEGPAMDQNAQTTIRGKILEAVPDRDYDTMMEKADSLIDDEGYSVDDVYEVVNQIEEEGVQAEDAAPQEQGKVIALEQPEQEYPAQPTVKEEIDEFVEKAKAEKRLMLSARSEGPAKGMRKRVVEAAVNRLQRKAKNALPLKVVQSFDELPQHVRDEAKRNDSGVIEGAHDGSTAYLVADNIPTRQRAVALWMHEQGVHTGLKGLFGPFDYRQILNQVYMAAGGKKAFKAIAKRYKFDLSNPIYQRKGAEEYLAHLAEKVEEGHALEGREIPAWRRFVKAVVGWLRRMGMDIKLTNSEIAWIVNESIRGTVHGVQEAAPEQGMAPAVAFAINEDVDPDQEVAVVDLSDVKPFKKISGPLSKAFVAKWIGAPLSIRVDENGGWDISLFDKNPMHPFWSGRTAPSHRSRTSRRRSLAALDRVLQGTVRVETFPNEDRTRQKKDVKTIHRFYVPVAYGDQIRTMRIVAFEKDGMEPEIDGVQLYDVIEEDPRPAMPDEGSASGVSGTSRRDQSGGKSPVDLPSRKIKIRDLLRGVKDSEGNAYFSDEDGAQKDKSDNRQPGKPASARVLQTRREDTLETTNDDVNSAYDEDAQGGVKLARAEAGPMTMQEVLEQMQTPQGESSIPKEATDVARILTGKPSEIAEAAAGGESEISNRINKKDLSILQEVASLPHWIAKRFPQFDAIYRRQLSRMDERAAVLKESLEEVEDFFTDMSKEDHKELRDIIWKIDGKKLEGMGDKFVRVQDDEGRDVMENGRPVLEINDEYYQAFESWTERQGLTPKVKTALVALRKSLDKDFLRAYDAMRQMAEIDDDTIKEFRSNINHTHNYFPHKRYGAYYVQAVGDNHIGQTEGGKWAVFNADGQIVSDEFVQEKTARKHLSENKRSAVYREHFDANTKWLAERSGKEKIAALKEKYSGDLKWSMGTNERLPDEVYEFGIDTNAMEQIIMAAADNLENKDQAKEIKTNLASAAADVMKSRGWSGASIKRKGIPGHELDDIQGVIYDYKAGLSGWLTKMEASRDFTGMLGKINAKHHPREYNYATKYVQNMLRNADRIDRAVGNIKAVAFLWYLGFNVKTAVLNLTQNIIVGWPRLGMDTSAASLKYIKAGMATLTDALTRGNALPKDEAKLMDELYREDVITEGFLNEIRGRVQGVSVAAVSNKVLKWAGMPMAIAERFNRASLALAAYRAARDGKITNKKTLSAMEAKPGQKLSYEKAKAYAEDIVRDSHFVYGKTNLPQPLRNSTIGRGANPAYTFRTFSHNILSIWNWMLQTQGVEGRVAFAKSMLGTMTVGGFTALPFYATLMHLFQWFTGSDDDWTEEIRKRLPEGDMLRDIITYGLPAGAGFSLGGSVGLETPVLSRVEPGASIEETLADNLGEVLGIPYDMFIRKPTRFVKAMKAGDEFRAVEEVSPTIVKNAMAGYRMWKRGQTSMSGKPINEPGQAGPRKLTESEAIGKVAGFQPISSRKSFDKYRARNVSKMARSEKASEFANKIVRAQRDEDTPAVQSVVREWKEWNAQARKNRELWKIITEKDIMTRIRSRSKNQSVSQRDALRIQEQMKAY